MKNYILATTLLVASHVGHAAEVAELKIGVEAMYAPFEFKDSSGKLAGFDIELGNALCAEMKVKCTWVEVPFDGLIPNLLAKKIDLINSVLSITEERKKAVGFSAPVYQLSSQLVARKSAKLLPTADSLNGKVVGVLQGSNHEIYAKKHWAPKGVKVVVYPNMGNIYTELTAGRVDAAFAESLTTTTSFLSKPQGKEFTLSGAPVNDAAILGNGIGIAMRKNDTELKKKLDDAYSRIKSNGTFNKLMKKYFIIDISI